MKTSSILLATLSLAAVFSLNSRQAKAGTCWYETAFYEKWGCQIVGQTPAGKYILLCCN